MVKAPFRIRRSALPGFWALLRCQATGTHKAAILANNPLMLIEKFFSTRVARCGDCGSFGLQLRKNDIYICRNCGYRGVVSL